MNPLTKRRNYSPEEVVNIYKRHGSIITLEKATLVLEFFKKLAHLTIEQMTTRG